MRIYRPRVRPGFDWAIPVHDTDHERLWSLGGVPRRGDWRPLEVTLLTEDDRGAHRAAADLPWLGGHVLVLRPAAVTALGPLLAPFGELLPLACPDADLTLFHTLTVLDALNEEESAIVRFDDGAVLDIDSYAFHAERVTAPVFKLPQLLRGPLFVTEDIAAAAAKLTGTTFAEVWSS